MNKLIYARVAHSNLWKDPHIAFDYLKSRSNNVCFRVCERELCCPTRQRRIFRLVPHWSAQMFNRQRMKELN